MHFAIPPNRRLQQLPLQSSIGQLRLWPGLQAQLSHVSVLHAHPPPIPVYGSSKLGTGNPRPPPQEEQPASTMLGSAPSVPFKIARAYAGTTSGSAGRGEAIGGSGGPAFATVNPRAMTAMATLHRDTYDWLADGSRTMTLSPPSQSPR
jgi:hypothetical protein